MDAIECITTRQSIRGFKPEPVPKNVLMEIFDIARWSPSYKNSQPWEAIILSGAKKTALTKMVIERFESGAAPTPDLAAPEAWPPAEEARISNLYKRRAELTGIDLANPDIIRKAKKANFGFYGAPHAVYLFQEASLSLWSLFDLGLFTQTLMLAAHAKGVGTVPQAFATDYAGQIKEYLEIPASKRLVLGLSVGYPDLDSPANKFRTDRAIVDEFVRWVE